MSDFIPTDGSFVGQAIDENSSTKLVELGRRVKAKDMAATDYGLGEFIYAEGVASTVVGSCVIISPDDWSTALASANGEGIIAFAMAATVANEYGWYQIYGKAVGKVLAGFADDAACYLTATAGSLDDTVVAGDLVYGALSASAIDTPSTGLAELEINYPHVTNASN